MILGRVAIATAVAATKIQKVAPKLVNNSPSAITVPRSVTKHAARMSLPSGVSLRPVSTITAYTTATEVVDMASPAICAARSPHPNTNCANIQASANGAAKLTTPSARLAFQNFLMTALSSSAPARNVRTSAPRLARKLTQGVISR